MNFPQFYFHILVLLFLGSLCSCTSVYNLPVDPQNTYTAESTYLKEVGEFPFITVASRELPSGVREYKNLTYVRYGQRKLQLDIYAPEMAAVQQLRPAIVLVHGGGWRAGYRENFTALAQQLALRGYVVATISYRLAPEAKYPAAIYDVKAAIRWLRSNAKTYGVNPHTIAVGGGSAGGQIASLTGVTNGMRYFDPQSRKNHVSSDVQAILNIDGLSDFTSAAARLHEDDPRKNPSAAGFWFGGNYAEKTALWHEASPIIYVHENMPPILFINSSRPRFGVGRDEMIALMKPLNVNYRVEVFDDAPHSFWLLDPWVNPTADIIAAFLKQQFHDAF